LKGIAEGTYKNKHAEAAKLYIYTITYTCTYAHIHTGTWRGLAKIVVETEVVIEEQILHILRRVVAAPSPGAIIAEKTAALERECSCRARARMLLAVSDTVFGWGSRPLVSFAQYLAGRWRGRQCSLASRRQVWCLLSAAIRLLGITRGVSFRVRGQSSPHRAKQRLSPGRARDHPALNALA
jgi:hypothetical protein